ncbi:MAG TPA: serine protease [Pirellulales bacterium]|nr:serine protease [Pirellulales bacterium]
MRRRSLLFIGVLGLIGTLRLPTTNDRLWADSFTDIGAAPVPRAVSMVSPGGDPDANLPTEDIHPHPAVVRVIVPERGGTSYGSGTLVHAHGEYGLVITNWHVVGDAASPPTVLFADGFRSLAAVVKTDRDWDLAALVIWRPNIDPVPLANAPPQPGEVLSIAGYGQGPYRLASGRCTNYLQPNTRLPRELVELAAAARQGDSGGPIFNRRGELAGVLWGEGNGFTTGSYCGRVRQFLQGVVPEGSGDETQLVSVPTREAARRGTVGMLASSASRVPTDDPRRLSAHQGSAIGTVFASRPPASLAAHYEEQSSSDTSGSEMPDWRAWLGRTRPEQGKTLLAVIGALAVALRVRRSINRGAATAGQS